VTDRVFRLNFLLFSTLLAAGAASSKVFVKSKATEDSNARFLCVIVLPSFVLIMCVVSVGRHLDSLLYDTFTVPRMSVVSVPQTQGY
jgi:hypothetical protein